MKKLSFIIAAILFVLTCSVTTKAQVITSAQIDSLTELTLKTFDVPGISVGVIKDGKLIHAKGYGVRSLRTMQKVDENTLFGVASNSKAFTTAALGMLIDEGKLKWDDKVTDKDKSDAVSPFVPLKRIIYKDNDDGMNWGRDSISVTPIRSIPRRCG